LASEIIDESLQVGEENVYQILIENRVILLELIKSLRHLVCVLDAKANILLHQSTTSSVWECTVILLHLGWRVEPATVVGKFEVHEVVEL